MRPVFWAALACLLLAGCAGVGIVAERYYDVDVPEAVKLLRDPDTFIVDVRPPDEFEQGHIKGAISIPLSQLWWRDDELPLDKGHKILVYDSFGERSARASFRLKEAGYTAIHNLEGGVAAWTAVGLPLIRASSAQ